MISDRATAEKVILLPSGLLRQRRREIRWRPQSGVVRAQLSDGSGCSTDNLPSTSTLMLSVHPRATSATPLSHTAASTSPAAGSPRSRFVGRCTSSLRRLVPCAGGVCTGDSGGGLTARPTCGAGAGGAALGGGVPAGTAIAGTGAASVCPGDTGDGPAPRAACGSGAVGAMLSGGAAASTSVGGVGAAGICPGGAADGPAAGPAHGSGAGSAVQGGGVAAGTAVVALEAAC